MSLSKNDRHALIIGAMKCGTTALFQHLAQTYEDVRPTSPKDTRFFAGPVPAGNWDKGLTWYRQTFANRNGLCLEASTQCAKFPDVQGCPERIAEALPSVRLIYLYRDPLDRAVSHYFHNVWKDSMAPTRPEEIANPNGKYLQYSDYALQLGLYHAHFEAERILVLNVVDTPFTAVARRKLEAHLDLPQTTSSPPLLTQNATEDNSRFNPQFPTLATLMTTPNDRLKALRLLGLKTSTLSTMAAHCMNIAHRFSQLTSVNVDPWLERYEAMRQ